MVVGRELLTADYWPHYWPRHAATLRAKKQPTFF